MRGRVISLPAGLVGDEAAETADDAAVGSSSRRPASRRDAPLEFLGGGRARPASRTNRSSSIAPAGFRTGADVGPEAITLHEVPLLGVRDWTAERERRGAAIHPLLWAGLYLARL